MYIAHNSTVNQIVKALTFAEPIWHLLCKKQHKPNRAFMHSLPKTLSHNSNFLCTFILLLFWWLKKIDVAGLFGLGCWRQYSRFAATNLWWKSRLLCTHGNSLPLQLHEYKVADLKSLWPVLQVLRFCLYWALPVVATRIIFNNFLKATS